MPTGLTAAAANCSQINLSWNPSAGATAYQVYTWQNSTWTELTRVTTASASATGLAGSTTYYYAVAALYITAQTVPRTR
jgi:hypothetical protein